MKDIKRVKEFVGMIENLGLSTVELSIDSIVRSFLRCDAGYIFDVRRSVDLVHLY